MMTSFKSDYKEKTLIVIIITTLVRIVMSLITDITAQEAYYSSFALFPELSSFDQPPMIGWLIQLTTNNFALNSPLFLRLGALICGILTSWVIFITGRRFFFSCIWFLFCSHIQYIILFWHLHKYICHTGIPFYTFLSPHLLFYI